VSTLSVDPGVNGTGWAKWKNGNFVGYGTLHYKQTGEWLLHAREIVVAFAELVRLHKAMKLVIECPVFMRGYGGYTTASTGDLVKLTLLTGMLVESFFEHAPGEDVVLVEPSKWKGQLPKDVCRKRVEAELKTSFDLLLKERISSHAVDAIGIGLWAHGRFK